MAEPDAKEDNSMSNSDPVQMSEDNGPVPEESQPEPAEKTEAVSPVPPPLSPAPSPSGDEQDDWGEQMFEDGNVVWVKWKQCWWPAEVKSPKNVPEEVLRDYRADYKKMPIAFVKFFDEDAYEFVRDPSSIVAYNCERKEEFIRKALSKYRNRVKEGSSAMKKFPEDVMRAEKVTGGDPNILARPQFSPQKSTVSYKDIFGDPNESKKKKKDSLSGSKSTSNGVRSSPSGARRTPVITHPRFLYASDHEIRIRQQPSMSSNNGSSPSSSQGSDRAGSTPTGTPGQYKCHTCDFTSTRLNVIVLHSKTHSDKSGQGQRQSQASKRAVAATKEAAKRRLVDRVVGGGQSSAKVVVVGSSQKKKPSRKPRASPSKSATSTKTAAKSEAKKSSKVDKKKEMPDTTKLLADWDDEENSEEEKGEIKKKDEDETEVAPAEKPKSDELEEEESESEEEPELDRKNEPKPDPALLNKAFEALLAETTVPSLPDIPATHTDTPEAEPAEPEGPTETDTTEEPAAEPAEEPVAELAVEPTPKSDADESAKASEPSVATELTSNAVLHTDASGTTYVLVTIDESGAAQFPGAAGAASGTASGSGAPDGSTTRMLYIDPSSLTTDEMGNIILAIDPREVAAGNPEAAPAPAAAEKGEDIVAVALAAAAARLPEPDRPDASAVIVDHAYSEAPKEAEKRKADDDSQETKRAKLVDADER